MKLKWLLLLSLISISLVVANGDDDESVKVDSVNENYDDVNYDENDDETKVVEETPTDTSVDEDPKTDAEIPDDGEPTNEDAVDVEEVAIEKQKGKYMNYDDYFVASALDGSDSDYNWNGKLPNPELVGTFPHALKLHIKFLKYI